MKCENCGSNMSAGYCSYCQEEAYIFFSQYEYLPETISSNDFSEKLKAQIEEKKKKGNK